MARATAVAVLVLFVAGIGSALAVGGDEDDGREGAARSTTTAAEGDDDEETTSTSTTEPAAPPARPPGLEAAVAELSAFVAKTRALEFQRPVEVELLDGDAFNARLFEDAEEDRADVEESERVLRALQLIPPDVDLFETVQSFLGDSVLGFYDPETDELVIRGAELTPYVRTTLVHELTHALDDQYFELNRPDLAESDDERFTAFQALYEGSAVRVDQAYRAALSEGEQEEADREEREFSADIDLSGVPPVIPDLLSFPYVAGAKFVERLVEDGGEVRLDEAFRDPPVTSEQILHPESFLDREPVATVDMPAADGEILEQGTYGEWVLLLTLAQEVSVDAAREAADGWGGDAYVAWADGERACLRATFVSDTPTDHDQLDAAWRKWAAGHGDARVETTADAVTVTACG